MAINLKIQQNIPLAPFTTFKIGGPAKFFVEAQNKDELLEAVKWAREKKEKIFILGGGSNVLINDNGVDGLVIKIKNQKSKIKNQKLECGAGALLSEAVKLAADNDLTGMEWAAGIPGTIGGAVRGNAGAFGSAVGDLIKEMEIFDCAKMEFKKLGNKTCEFSYRESAFKKGGDKKIIWQIIMVLKTGDRAEINKKIKQYIRHRADSQPKAAGAGCIFKNLTLANLSEFNANLANKAEEEKIAKKGMVSAGWIIDQLGLKGKTIGHAMISQEHANFIVNTGKATASDIIMLASYIKQQVRNKLGVQLQEEIQYFGF